MTEPELNNLTDEEFLIVAYRMGRFQEKICDIPYREVVNQAQKVDFGANIVDRRNQIYKAIGFKEPAGDKRKSNKQRQKEYGN